MRLWRGLRPVQMFAGSFVLLIGMGTLGLRLLPGLYTGAGLGWTDSLFTATSAACVTGLIVVDTATYFTPLGQAFVLLLIQLGGLGIITFTTLILLGLGGRLSLRWETMLGGAAEIAPHVDPRRLARNVLKFTFAFEAAGALLLYALWVPRLGWGAAAWDAVFHAISAFCNAGFSTFSDSLVAFDDAPLTLLVVSALIVVGGLGFLTLEELRARRSAKLEQRSAKVSAGSAAAAQDTKLSAQGATLSTPAAAAPARAARLSTHTRLALAATAVLLIVGWFLFAMFEWDGALAGLSLPGRVVNALFLSVTPRTAGFSTIDYGTAADSTNFLTIILMSIGGSPGSMAGGLKTTTFALIGLLAWSRLRGERLVSLGGRTVPAETVERAVGLVVVMYGVMTAAVFAFVASDARGTGGARFLAHMFEAASALNTVGLSMGVTPHMSGGDRLLAVLLMYLGRIGPLTFAASIALRRPRPSAQLRYAYEDVAVG